MMIEGLIEKFVHFTWNLSNQLFKDFAINVLINCCGAFHPFKKADSGWSFSMYLRGRGTRVGLLDCHILN